MFMKTHCMTAVRVRYTFSLTQFGWSPLHFSIFAPDVTDAHVQIVERLLASRADPNKIVEGGHKVCIT